MSHSRSSGFSLLEIAIVMTIIGVLLGSGILALTGILNDARYKTTQKQLDRIADAVAVYTQRNYFVPCPAPQPAGNVTPTGVAAVACANAGATGIVPYATLGLTLEQIRDGYGNYITYAVSPVGTQSVLNNSNPDLQCRYRKIWVIPPDGDANPTGTGGIALNEAKARFCCPTINSSANHDPNRDLRITNNAGNLLVPTPRTAATGAAATSWGTQVPPVPPATFPITQTPVVVLVSHGRNGFGAFMPNNTRRLGAGAIEALNADGDRDYRAGEFSTNANNFFDDIIIWRTQEQLMSSFGRDSCTRP
jgi:prepilin-type N-terminal cleavage/methylation domain-containing protein